MKNTNYALLISLLLLLGIAYLFYSKIIVEAEHPYQVGEFPQANQQLLFNAIRDKNVSKVAELAAITDLNTLSNNQASLLMVAVLDATDYFNNLQSESNRLNGKYITEKKIINQKQAKIITILVENGADPTIREEIRVYGNKLKTGKAQVALRTSVIKFVTRDFVPDQILDAILAGGFDPNSQLKDKRSDLINSVLTSRKFAKLKLLVGNYNASIAEGGYSPPTVLAIEHGSPQSSLYLLEHGADPHHERLAYLVFERINEYQQYSENPSKSIQQELDKYLQIKQFLIKEGVFRPPEKPSPRKRDLKKEYPKKLDDQ